MDSNEPIVTPPDLLTALEALEREWRETGPALQLSSGMSPHLAAAMAVAQCADQLAAICARYDAEDTDEIAALRAQVKNLERLLSVD